MGVHIPQGKGKWGFCHIGLNRISLTEMYSTCAWKVDNISVQSVYRWKRLFIGFPKIKSVSRSKLGFTINLQKYNNDFTKNHA